MKTLVPYEESILGGDDEGSWLHVKSWFLEVIAVPGWVMFMLKLR